MAFDGEFVWVGQSFFGSSVLHQVDPLTCEVVGSILAPVLNPFDPLIAGLAWDGASLWVATEHAGLIYKIAPDDGTVLHVIPSPSFGQNVPFSGGLAWDGQTLWQADIVSPSNGLIFQLDPVDGTILKFFSFPGMYPAGLGFSGGVLIATDLQAKQILEIDPEDGSVLSSCPAPAEFPWGLAVDPATGDSWAADSLSDRLYLLDTNLPVSPLCYTLDFRTADDFTTLLVNGQHINDEFGERVLITSTGSNAGPAIFDSTIAGPNDPSQDLDLLVGSGNILILQTENLAADGEDVFPLPNDDADGGTLRFIFGAENEVTSLALIDVDSGDGDWSVVLTDSSGLRRRYDVPSNWTGDLTGAGPGRGTLDLTQLAPQAGFGSVATASQDGGFEPTAVVQLDVNLGGTGGLDDLGVCRWPSESRAPVKARPAPRATRANSSRFSGVSGSSSGSPD